MPTARWARLFLFAPQEECAWANANAAALDFDKGGNLTLSVRLSSDGAEPATHCGASSLVRPHVHGVIVAQLLPAKPSCKVYNAADGWTWESALADMGLEPILGDL